MELYATNAQIVYMGALHVLGLERIKLPAIAPPFLATVAKVLGIEIELVDIDWNMGAQAHVLANPFESFTPEAPIIIQGAGPSVGSGEIFIKEAPSGVVVEVEDPHLFQELSRFLDGGLRPRAMGSFEVVGPGLRDRRDPFSLDLETIQAQEETIALLDEAFRENPYFDTLPLGKRTLKMGYPILLKPSLYCPKEDIWASLRERQIPVQAPFRPLYRSPAIGGEFLPTSEEFYKAHLVLPIEAGIIQPLFEVLETYRYRGCRF
ncbi:MAG: hypothetical protein C6I00_07215 [Nitratiruptor sp.]|nr:hypothetical protein [Nitratiruptor sp.]NPA83824.1 hypothetical protein [Campylobacterota bacterium]